VVVAAATAAAVAVAAETGVTNCARNFRVKFFVESALYPFARLDLMATGPVILRLVLKEELVAILSAGLYIKHFQYGCGVITESGQDRTTIDFDAHGIKKFVTSLMVVEPAEGTPPKRRRTRRVKPVKTPPAVAARVFIPGAK
jgi:hypothetical protein